MTRTRWIIEITIGLAGVLLLYWAWNADRSWYERHMTWASCVMYPGEMKRFQPYRWVGAGFGVVLLAFVRPFAVRRLGKLSPREALYRILPSALAVVMSFVAADVILRKKKRPEPPVGLTIPLSVPNADYGWAHAASQTTVLPYGDRKVEYVTDAAGNRVRSAAEPTDFAKPAILFPGESIAIGLGLDYDDTYVARVAAKTGLEGVNLAVTAYSNDQAYVRLAQQLPRFQHPVAVVTLIVQAQIKRNTEIRFPHLIPDAEGNTHHVAAASELYLDSPMRDLINNKIGLHTDEHYRIARDVIAATARAARARGAYPLFVFTHWSLPCDPADDGGPPPLEHALFDGLDVPFVYVQLDPAWRYPDSDHPDGRAHAHIADVIVDELVKAGTVGRPPPSRTSNRDAP